MQQKSLSCLSPQQLAKDFREKVSCFHCFLCFKVQTVPSSSPNKHKDKHKQTIKHSEHKAACDIIIKQKISGKVIEISSDEDISEICKQIKEIGTQILLKSFLKEFKLPKKNKNKNKNKNKITQQIEIKTNKNTSNH